MKEIGSFLLLVLLIATGVWFYRRHQENERKKKELEAEQARQRELERQKLYDFFKSKLDRIKTANEKFAEYIDFKTGYFTNYQLTTWKTEQTNLFNEIKGKPFDFINLSNEEVNSIKTFTEYFNNAATLRNDFNKNFVKEELKTYSKFFDNIEGRKLDIQQRTAVVTDEDNNIVIAGAGSGKTTTIVGKVNYVLERYKVRPEEILLISFTNKSAKTLAKRINIEGVEAKTFHKFGKDVIRDVEGIAPTVFGDNKDETNDTSQFKELLKGFFKELIKEKSYLKMVTRYFSDFLKPPISQFEFKTQGEYIQYLKDQNFKTYKQIIPNGLTTLHREIVKSVEECKIANFLFFNSVEYKYEEPYEIETATFHHGEYKPDFSIYQNGKRIYLEHFGISRNGNVPSWFTGDGTRSASEKYRDDMEWKRNTHRQNGTILIESYSYEMSEGILFENLTNNLKSAGVILKPKSPEEIWKIISEAAKDEINSFITLFGTFITLMKSNNYSINDVINRNKQTQDKFYRDRNSLFIEIIKPIFERYENHLKERNEIDFSDMINKASKHIASGNENLNMLSLMSFKIFQLVVTN